MRLGHLLSWGLRGGGGTRRRTIMAIWPRCRGWASSRGRLRGPTRASMVRIHIMKQRSQGLRIVAEALEERLPLDIILSIIVTLTAAAPTAAVTTAATSVVTTAELAALLITAAAILLHLSMMDETVVPTDLGHLPILLGNGA